MRIRFATCSVTFTAELVPKILNLTMGESEGRRRRRRKGRMRSPSGSFDGGCFIWRAVSCSSIMMVKSGSSAIICSNSKGRFESKTRFELGGGMRILEKIGWRVDHLLEGAITW
jgi:hypothetical protein